MLIYLKKKQNKIKTKLQIIKKVCIFTCVIFLLLKKKSIPSRNSVKTKNEFVWFQYFYLFYNLINEHVLNISDYEILG